MTDEELAEMFRRSLDRHADDVTDTDTGGRAAEAYLGVRRRRRRQAVGVAAAIAVVLVPVAVLAMTSGDTTKTVSHPSSWRPESYNGIQLWVPPSWGWGGVPASARRPLLPCGAWSYSGTALGSLHLPPRPGPAPSYVGRPLDVGSDCETQPPAQARHVWFDSPLAVGSSPTQRTFLVYGLSTFKVTVADPDPVELASIVGSLQHVTTDRNGCSARPPRLPWDSGSLVPVQVTSMSICLYSARGVGNLYLSYSTHITGPAAKAAVSAIQASEYPGGLISSGCLQVVSSGLAGVTLTAHTPQGSHAYRIDPAQCDGPVTYRGIDQHPLTKESARIWAVDGVPVYASGPNGLSPYLPR